MKKFSKESGYQQTWQGFFQLLVVCILNLGAVLVMEHFFQRSRAVDAVLTVIAEYLKDHPDKSYYGDGMYDWKREYMQENDRMNQPVTLWTFNLSYLHAKRIFSENSSKVPIYCHKNNIYLQMFSCFV